MCDTTNTHTNTNTHKHEHTQRHMGQQSYINSSALGERGVLIGPRCGLSQVITVIGTLLKRVMQLCPGGEHRKDLNSTN